MIELVFEIMQFCFLHFILLFAYLSQFCKTPFRPMWSTFLVFWCRLYIIWLAHLFFGGVSIGWSCAWGTGFLFWQILHLHLIFRKLSCPCIVSLLLIFWRQYTKVALCCRFCLCHSGAWCMNRYNQSLSLRQCYIWLWDLVCPDFGGWKFAMHGPRLDLRLRSIRLHD